MTRAWRTMRAQILASLNCKLVSGQSAIPSRSSMQRRKEAKL